MSRKHVVEFQAFTAANATTTQTSPKTNCEQHDSCSYHVKFSAANSGTFTVEARNESYEKQSDSELNWYALNFGVPLTIAAETDVQILMNVMDFAEVRLKWAPSAGAGTMSAFLNMKSKGA